MKKSSIVFLNPNGLSGFRFLGILIISFVSFVLCPTYRISGQTGPVDSVFFNTDFEDEETGTLPFRWMRFGGDWGVIGENGKAVRQSSTALERAFLILGWRNYTVESKIFVTKTRLHWGVGLIAYWRDEKNNYRIVNHGSKLCLLRTGGGQTRVLAETPYLVDLGEWHNLKISISSDEDGVKLKGKAWSEKREEPSEWMVMANDHMPTSSAGWAGFWTGKAACDFDDFTVEFASSLKEFSKTKSIYSHNFDRIRKGVFPDEWRVVRGNWLIEGKGDQVLRQTSVDDQLAFNQNCYALLQEWRDYTVIAKVMCEPQSRSWAIGIVGYWQNKDNFYDLWLTQNQGVWLLRVNTSVSLTPVALKNADVSFVQGKWHFIKMQLETHFDEVKISAKIWEEGTVEPTVWLLQTVDDADNRILSGTIGFGSLKAVCQFDDVTVKPLAR